MAALGGIRGFLCPTSIFFTLLVAFLEVDSMLNENEISFIISKAGETNIGACRRLGATSNRNTGLLVDPIPWNLGYMQSVITSLNFTMMQPAVQGCCVPGLWCTNGSCFTMSLTGYFSNYGPIVQSSYLTVSALPVFACLISPSPFQSFSNSLLYNVKYPVFTLMPSNPKYTVNGGDEGSLVVDIGQDVCHRRELCSATCKPCLVQSDCTSDALCLDDGHNSFCFPHCGGRGDISCPCSQTCHSVSVFFDSSPAFVNLHLCSPNSFLTSPLLSRGACGGVIYGDKLQCSAPHAFSPPPEDAGGSPAIPPLGIALAMTNQGLTAVDELFRPPGPQCIVDDDCFDGDLCTTDTCDTNAFICRYIGVTDTQCRATLQSVVDRVNPNTYMCILQKNQFATQIDMASSVLNNGQVSLASSYRDYPEDKVKIGFTFPFFGNAVHVVYINPNGVLRLPPLERCLGPLNSLLCVTYSTFNNVISLWSSNWDPPMSLSPAIIYYSPPSKDVFHVYYKQISKFMDNPVETSSFSASIHLDGSIRLRYHFIGSAFSPQDTFGVWGARASSTMPLLSSVHANINYHTENFTNEIIESGNDIILCPYSALVCPVNTCVSPVNPLVLNWKGISCSGLHTGTSDADVSYRCKWSAVSETISEGYISGKTLVCPVPSLSVPDGTLLSVDISFILSGTGGIISPDDDSKSLFAITQRRNGSLELSNHQIMVRYYSGGVNDCGCNPVVGISLLHETMRCDTCNVCGGYDRTVDCNGDCFGSAYNDSCQMCSRGLTGVDSISTCTDPPQFDYGDAELLNILSWAVVLAIFGCFGCMGLCCFYVLRQIVHQSERQRRNEPLAIRRMRRVATALGIGPITLTTEQIHSIGEFTYSNNQSESSGQVDCSICLIDLEDGDVCRRLPEPCGHVFHKSCIDPWLQQSHYCPLCKRPINELLQKLESDGLNGSNSVGHESNHLPPVGQLGLRRLSEGNVYLSVSTSSV